MPRHIETVAKTLRPCEPACVEPPDGSGWQLHGPYGAQRFKDGQDGYVVRLADVVRWLMQGRGMSFANAVRAVCAPLEGDAPPLVYHLDPMEDAEPQNEPSEWLELLDGCDGLHLLPPQVAHAALAARDMRASWLIKPHELARLVNAPGQPIEYDGTQESPFEFSERTDRSGGPQNLAVPFAVAHALWGWGTVKAGAIDGVAAPATPADEAVKDYATLCKFMQSHKGKKGHERPLWRAEWVALARAEVKDRGRGGRAAVAVELGISSEGLAQVFERHPEPQAGPFSVLGQHAA